MMRRFHITEEDRLLAAGLMSMVVAFGLPYARVYPESIATSSTIVIVAVLAAGAFVFSLSPLLHGSSIQKLLALTFMVPSLAFVAVTFPHWLGR
jgi:hypothetical protein